MITPLQTKTTFDLYIVFNIFGMEIIVATLRVLLRKVLPLPLFASISVAALSVTSTSLLHLRHIVLFSCIAFLLFVFVLENDREKGKPRKRKRIGSFSKKHYIITLYTVQ